MDIDVINPFLIENLVIVFFTIVFHIYIYADLGYAYPSLFLQIWHNKWNV